MEVKATSDVKHATDTLNTEKKKLRQLKKSHTDVSIASSFCFLKGYSKLKSCG